MPKSSLRAWDAVGIASIVLMAAILTASPVLDILHGLSLDTLTALRWRAFGNRHTPAMSTAVVIAFDEQSYRTPPFKGTPTITWVREIGRVITAVVDAGALVIGFDVVFPTSIEESQIPFEDQTVGSRLRGFDRDFLRALATAARAGKLVLGEIQQGTDSIMPSAGQRIAVGQRRNIRALNVFSDADDILRRVPLMVTVNDMLVPAMALELASRAQGAAPRVNADGTVRLGDCDIPARVPNALTLNFDGGANDIPTYSFADLRACLDKGNSEFFQRNFHNKVVILGSALDFEDRKMTTKRFATAPALSAAERCAPAADDRPPPVRTSIEGVYVHATAINNLLRHEAVAELGRTGAFFIILPAAALAAFCAWVLTPVTAALCYLLMAMAWTATTVGLFTKALALPLYEPLFAAVLALIATIGVRLLVADKNMRFLRRAFALYLAPAVIEKLVASKKPPALGGELRTITIFFSDIKGFSSFSETMKPTELVALMNRYLSAMTDVIEQHGGFVDKYIGDGIVAVFGAPVEGTDHAVQAVHAALHCCSDLVEFNRMAAASNSQTLAHRIGLNSGQAVVGNIGSRRRFNYTVIGDSVNLASRLEGANKQYGTSILASEATVELTGNTFRWREIGTIRVHGRVQPVRVYEPIGEASIQPTQL